ncbi:MAG: hypothetical protein KGJ86_18955 [Chloroflexota bacterium]|nr:hypothetical protein [Chloroflexota bacterium]
MQEEVRRAPLLVVDGDNLAHRAYHAIPKSVRAAGGRPLNAIVGWTNMLLAVWETEQPRGVFVAWDTLGVPTYRHKLWPAYQAGRVFEPELLEQLETLPALAAAFGFGVGKQAGYEADDLMAAAVAEEDRLNGTSLVLTNDRDAYQLVSESVTVLTPRKSIADLVRIGPAEVVERLGVLPEQVPDYKALAGDPSDNVPGARGIGPKTAAALLLRYGSLDKIIEAHAAARDQEEMGQLLNFRDVVRMKANLPVSLPPSGPPAWTEAAGFLKELGADALARRVGQRAERLPL